MYQIDIGLGWSTLALKLENPWNPPEIWNKIQQHRVVLNQTIIDYYISQAEEKDLVPQCQDYIATIAGTDELSNHIPENNGGGFKKTLEQYFRSRNYFDHVIISENNELNFGAKVARFQYDSSNYSADTSSPLSMFSFSGSHTAQFDERATRYKNWFERLMIGEKEISFIDPYILSSPEICNAFCQVYLDLVKPNQKINIFCDKNKYEQTYIDKVEEISEKKGINNLSIFLCDYMHDRFIVGDSFEITIGFGLDFIRIKDDMPFVKQQCELSWKKKKKQKSKTEEYDYLEREIELAGNHAEQIK